MRVTCLSLLHHSDLIFPVREDQGMFLRLLDSTVLHLLLQWCSNDHDGIPKVH